MLVVVLENSHRHPNGTKIIARKIGSFLGAEANKSKDERDYKDEDDSLISGSGLKSVISDFAAGPWVSLSPGLGRDERQALRQPE